MIAKIAAAASTATIAVHAQESVALNAHGSVADRTSPSASIHSYLVPGGVHDQEDVTESHAS